jgi:hypothetical protein
MTVRRADRVSIDTACPDLGSPSSLDGVVEANDDRAAWHQAVDQYSKQTASNPTAGPAVAVQHTVVVGEVRGLLEAHHAQSGGDGAAAGGKDAPHDQYQNMIPCRCRETLSER